MAIYLDHHATTPCAPEVLEAMLPYFSQHFGNPMSGSHQFGWKASSAIARARKQTADGINATPEEIVFTSGATESVHLAIRGFIEERGKRSHIITAPTEHKCVIEACKKLEQLGHSVTWLKVNEFGQIDLNELKNAIRPGETAMISLMHANNEVGTIHPIKEIGKIAKEAGICFHVDAAQSFGRLPIDVRAMNIDLLSLSAHKFYGPKGSGALFVKSQPGARVHLAPSMAGGGQENGLRGGTHNVPGIVGTGVAAELAIKNLDSECKRLVELRDHMIKRLTTELDGVILNGHPTERLCNNVNVTILDVKPDSILLALHDVGFSSGSACSSGSAEASHVLQALGRVSPRQSTTLRFGLGRMNDRAEIDSVSERLIAAVRNARKNSMA